MIPQNPPIICHHIKYHHIKYDIKEKRNKYKKNPPIIYHHIKYDIKEKRNKYKRKEHRIIINIIIAFPSFVTNLIDIIN